MMMKLNPWRLGFAIGITWTIGVMLLGILAGANGYGQDLLEILSSIYTGYDTSLTGIVVGSVWAFVDGFVGGVVIARLYNFCMGCGKKKEMKTPATA